jgi:hypothetical protein
MKMLKFSWKGSRCDARMLGGPAGRGPLGPHLALLSASIAAAGGAGTLAELGQAWQNWLNSSFQTFSNRTNPKVRVS